MISDKKQIKKITEIFRKFLDGSESFCGVCFSGMYGMEDEIFFTAFEEYLTSGNNYLDEYTVLMNMDMDIHFYHSNAKQQFLQREHVLNNKGFWNIYDRYSEKEVSEFREVFLIKKHQYQRYLENEQRKKERKKKRRKQRVT